MKRWRMIENSISKTKKKKHNMAASNLRSVNVERHE